METIGSGRLKGSPFFAELNRGDGDIGIPSAISVVNGVFVGPTDIDRIQQHDGIYIQVNETGSFIQTVTVNNVKGLPVFTEFIGHYQGSVGHNVDYLNHNYNTTLDDDTGDNLVHSVTDKIQRVPFPAISSDYVSAEEAQVLLDHVTAPSGTHNLFTDSIRIVWAGVLMPVIGPPVTILNWTAGETKDVTIDAALGKIIADVKGRYRVDIIGSVYGTATAEMHIHLFKNGVLFRRIGAACTFNIAGDVTPIVGGGSIDLAAGDVLELKAFSNIADSYMSFEHGIFRIEKLGG